MLRDESDSKYSFNNECIVFSKICFDETFLTSIVFVSIVFLFVS